MDLYKITFHTTHFFNLQHIDATAETANHFHIYKSKKKIGEQPKLYKAIQVIIDHAGEHPELKGILKVAHFFQKPDPLYQCIGIDFHPKYGVKINMKLNEPYATG